MSPVPTASSFDSVVTEEVLTNDSSTDSPSLLSVSREADASSTKNATSSPAAPMRNGTIFVQPDNSSAPVVSTTITSTTQESLTNGTLQFTTVTASTVASTTEVARTTTTTTTAWLTTTTQTTVTTVAIEVTTMDKTTTTAPRTSASPPTAMTSTSTLSPKITTPTPGLHTTSATEGTPLQCNITEKLWVKTVLSMRRSRLDGTLKLSLPKGLTQALQRALNDSSIHAKVSEFPCVFGCWDCTAG
ncbi:hypothetical protein SKAU_G00244520 [Synaphobranchus kaupii]|uniref:Uncharacterized protein n=1 Tax=Synaphobranchus kaupii TaxID=118154 RepID=A0A9Q1F210_SYNKA|nr:hypothetical protein SKAU_G00244520 [Synaphobranchus kaupii]